MSARKLNDDGFTLLEVLVSFAVAGLVVAIVIPATLMARQRLRMAEIEGQQSQSALALIDEMAATGLPIESQRIGDMQLRGTFAFVDDQTRARFRLAKLEVATSSVAHPDSLPTKISSIRLVAVRSSDQTSQ
jgi:prepilin-type N-terminal cleavage/methylation domain-containing protein